MPVVSTVRWDGLCNIHTERGEKRNRGETIEESRREWREVEGGNSSNPI